MNKELFLIRAKSFLCEAGSLLLVAVVGVIASPNFEAMVQDHFGAGLGGTFALLVVSAVVKHLRNLKVLKEARLGATQGKAIHLF